MGKTNKQTENLCGMTTIYSPFLDEKKKGDSEWPLNLSKIT